MANYFLIHGALRGAWLWERLMPLLLRGGGNPVAIDLPGHGDRSSDRKGVTMSTYIEDVFQYIRKEQMKELILVGHSMAGIIISKVAEEMPERVKHLVYLAAVVPKDGEALIDLVTRERQEKIRHLQGKASEIFGNLETLRPFYFTDLEGEEQAYFLKQLTPQPLAAFFEKIRFSKFPDVPVPKTYIMGLKDKSLPPELTKMFAERLGVKPVEIDAGHDMMASRPEEVSRVLLNIP